MKKILGWCLSAILGGCIAIPIGLIAQDWYAATGKPVQGSALVSADFRTEFQAIQNNISAKLPTLAGNGNYFVKVNSGGTALTAVNYEESGTFVATFTTGCTVNPTATFDWQREGNIVALKMVDGSGWPCTSNSSFTSTAGATLPAAITPASTVLLPMFGGFSNNGTNSAACFYLDNVGSIQIFVSTGSAGPCFTGAVSSGSKGFTSPTIPIVFTYMLTNP